MRIRRPELIEVEVALAAVVLIAGYVAAIMDRI